MCWSHDSAESKVVAFHSEYEDYSIESDDSSSLSFYRPFDEHRKLLKEGSSTKGYNNRMCNPECDGEDYALFGIFVLFGSCLVVFLVLCIIDKRKKKLAERKAKMGRGHDD